MIRFLWRKKLENFKINSVGVKNFRSLKDVEVPLGSLTVLLGRNNCGKSSFLRIFPLLRQSCYPSVRGALSLYDEDMVDFGSYVEVVTDSPEVDKNAGFVFSFKGECKDFGKDGYIVRNKIDRSSNSRDCGFTVSLTITEAADILVVSKFSLEIETKLGDGSEIKKEYYFEVDVKTNELVAFKLDGKDYLVKIKDTLKVDKDASGRFFPALFIDVEYERRFSRYSSLYYLKKELLGLYFSGEEVENENYFRYEELAEEIASFIIENVSEKKDNLEKLFKRKESNIERTSLSSREKFFAKIRENLEKPENLGKKDDILCAIEFYEFYDVYRTLEDSLIEIFSNVYYSQPIRVKAERFYRSRSLKVNEVSSDGSNLVQFYFSAIKEKRGKKEEFEKWLKENFKFYYTVENPKGLQSIYIYTKSVNVDGKEEWKKFNILDTGFGFQQILPIVTQLWYLSSESANPAKNRIRRHLEYSNTFIFAIEQPELHLHPAMQALFVRSLAKIVEMFRNTDVQIKFILETHSETIVNRIGSMVSHGNLEKDEAKIIIFEKDSDSGFVGVSESCFYKNGLLSNWPVDFFGFD